MTLEEQLNTDLKEAMRTGDEPRKLAIRAVKTAVTEAKVSGTQLRDLTDADVLAIIGKQIKQRRDSQAIFETAGRMDLAAQEAAELVVLEQYLPPQMDEAAIREHAVALTAELGVTDIKGIGPVMKRMTADLRGQADGQTINRIVRELLN
jgi:uncharacterized protein